MNRFFISFVFLFYFVFSFLHIFAKNSKIAAGVKKAELPLVYLPDNLSVHFVSPEPIQYVDISSKSIIGDIPVKNVLRIKYRPDSLKTLVSKDAVVTIIAENFIVQYHIINAPDQNSAGVQTGIEISPLDTRPLDFPGLTLSQPELKNYAVKLLYNKPEKLQTAKAYGLQTWLNHVYTLGNYIFLDITYKNGNKLNYDIDEIRFKIDDKKQTKATTVQSLEIKPDFTLFDISSFKKYYRNIFVFRKFTFPGNKLLNVEMSEKQLSGRIITLQIPYKEVLQADMIPL